MAAHPTPDAQGRRGGGAGRTLALALVLLAAVAAGYLLRAGPLLDDLLGRGEVVESGTTVVTGIRALQELTTVEAVEYVTLDAANDRGILNFALGDSVSMLAVARVRAGIDLSELERDDVLIDEQTNAVSVVLPRAQIQSVALDNTATEVYDRDTGLLTRGDDQLETRARRAAEELLGEQAVEAGLLDRADEEARVAVSELLEALGFDRVTVRLAGEELPS